MRRFLITCLLALLLIMAAWSAPIRAQSPEPRCMFPGPWQIDPTPLTVIDEGRTDPDLLEQYEGEGDNFHPFGLMGDPFVLVEDDTFRMWFTSVYETDDGREITGFAYSTSADGVVWTDPKAPHPYVLVDIILGADADEWDQGGIETTTIMRHPTTGQYYMFYAGVYTEEAYALGLATSNDGLRWTKHDEPILPAIYDWEQPVRDPRGVLVGGLVEPTVLYNQETSTFQLWYSALGVMDGVWGGRIGYATSTDGIHWERRSEPVFEPGDAGAWDAMWVSHSHVIADPDAGYHLVYAGESLDSTVYAIGHAYSPDGIQWRRNPANPIVSNEAGTWRSAMVGGPSALFHDNQMMLYYMGAQNRDFAYVHFGLATATCE